MKKSIRFVVILVLLLARSSSSQEPVNFSKQIKPLLSNKCYRCHGPDSLARQADLRLDRLDEVIRDDDELGVIARGKPELSEMVTRLRSSDPDQRMPPVDSEISLSEDQISLLVEWIRQGANHQTHWSFEPIQRPSPPRVTSPIWTTNPIDVFVLARLNREGLQPSPRADRITLIRRVSLDLTGLPPTPEEVTNFLMDKRPNAYQELVSRLLASPRYGEHMAVPWLEASRYADTNGYQHDFYRTVYPWRTWVIRALNENKPFDQFVVEQLAGDLLPEATDEQVLATCFLRLHRLNSENGSIDEEFYVENVVDRIETVSTALMGLTMGCARCHDHKFDPLSMRDFYSMFAYFNNGQDKGVDTAGLHRQPFSDPVIRFADVDQQDALGILERRLWKLKHDSRQEPNPDILASLQAEIANIQEAAPAVMIMRERDQRRPAYLLKRGAYDARGDQLEPGIPVVFGNAENKRGTRLVFARWLVSPDNPLFARVIVNRFWQMVFGTGLVRTSEDFGAQGEPPSHPDLLDWLATEFIARDFNVKSMLKLIVTSATYQQSSRATEDLMARDPENRLLARGPRFRLSGFSIRDQALMASGLLVEKIGGRSVRPYQPPRLWEEVSGDQKLSDAVQTTFYKMDKGAALYRRSIYTFWKRSVPPPSLSTFDAPNREMCNVRRSATNTPHQALMLLNDPTFLEAARHLATVMIEHEDTSDDARIRLGVQQLICRSPTDKEMTLLRRGLTFHRDVYAQNEQLAKDVLSHGESPAIENCDDLAEHAALAQIALVLLNMDETITKE